MQLIELEFVRSRRHKLQAAGCHSMVLFTNLWYSVAKVCQALPSNLVGWRFALEGVQWLYESPWS